MFKLIVCLLIFSLADVGHMEDSSDPQQIVEDRGFEFEKHHVVTEDCYILEMHRITGPDAPDHTPNKPPVLLQHGLGEASTFWMTNSNGGNLNDTDDRNLAFALAKRGYDVWMGNIRGNTYSRKHTTFSADDSEFWKFNFDNHALQDMPAQIAHVQAMTNYDQIAYVGFSQGTLTMFELLAFKPEVAKAIRVYVALAPVAFLGDISKELLKLTESKAALKVALYTNVELTPDSQYNKIFADIACRAFPGHTCEKALNVLMGVDEQQPNKTSWKPLWQHFLEGTSLPNFVHYLLNARSKEMNVLDYLSPETNMLCYNQTTPLAIPLEKITLEDMHLFSSQSDLMADPKDVERLKNALKVKFESKIIEVKGFSHTDFLFNEHVDILVYHPLLDILEKKKPRKSVGSTEQLHLKQFDESTCVLPKPDSLCHLDVQQTLQNIA